MRQSTLADDDAGRRVARAAHLDATSNAASKEALLYGGYNQPRCTKVGNIKRQTLAATEWVGQSDEAKGPPHWHVSNALGPLRLPLSPARLAAIPVPVETEDDFDREFRLSYQNTPKATDDRSHSAAKGS